MADTDKLKEHGWYLTEEGLNVLGVNGSIGDIKAFIRSAIDVDLREISAGSFPEEITKGKLDSVPGKIVVQIQKIRNISAPKANEESRAAPRMLKLSLSDGQTCCQAIELEHISSISLNTPPGTKLFLKTDLPMAHGILLLRPSCLEVLGGKVPHLVEKWELNRSLAKHTRGRVGEEGGPPPWIPFGEKILRINSQDRNFKSLDNTKDKENRDNTEFEAQRKDAIAEAARGGAKKVFGGGNKPLLDHNVQQIVDHGFSVEQAEYALRLFRNSVDRALKSLQKKEDGPRRDDRERKGEIRAKEERPERRKRGVREEETGAPPKPSGKVTLFDFFEDKLPVQNEKEPETRNFVSNGGVISGVDRRLTTAEPHIPRSVVSNKSNRPERIASHAQQQQQQQHHQHQPHQQQQSRRGGPRGGGNSGGGSNSGGNSGRGGRGNQSSNSSNTWGGVGDVRGGGSGSVGYTHREERPDRGRHPVGQGGNPGNQAQTLPPQKPPRFQNQQRLHQQHQQPQHQQHQQHQPHQQHQQHNLQHQHQHHQSQSQQQQQPPHHHQQQQQQPQHQLNQESGYGQQSWLSAYNDSYSNDNWPIGSTVNNGKLRDEYVNHGDSYLSNYDGGRNVAPRQGFTGGYDMGLEGQVNRGLGMKMDRLAGGRQFSSQQDALTQKLSSLQVQGGLGRDGFGYSSRPQGPSNQQNQLYNMNYSYKDPSPTPTQPLGSPPGLSSPPGYGGGGSGGGVYNTQSNHFLPEQKPWQWHEGDKCMAKYWEDNMYYNAEVTGVSERTCVVRFVEYGNFEEVLQDHCIPFTQDELGQTIQSSSAFNSSSDTLSAQNNNQNHFSGVLEFRRGGTRPYVKGGSNSGASGPGGSERKTPRAQQQMYVPPAQRK